MARTATEDEILEFISKLNEAWYNTVSSNYMNDSRYNEDLKLIKFPPEDPAKLGENSWKDEWLHWLANYSDGMSLFQFVCDTEEVNDSMILGFGNSSKGNGLDKITTQLIKHMKSRLDSIGDILVIYKEIEEITNKIDDTLETNLSPIDKEMSESLKGYFYGVLKNEYSKEIQYYYKYYDAKAKPDLLTDEVLAKVVNGKFFYSNSFCDATGLSQEKAIKALRKYINSPTFVKKSDFEITVSHQRQNLGQFYKFFYTIEQHYNIIMNHLFTQGCVIKEDETEPIASGAYASAKSKQKDKGDKKFCTALHTYLLSIR